MKHTFCNKLWWLIATFFVLQHLSAQQVKTVVRHTEVPLEVVGDYSSVQWQLSSDMSAWYDLPHATSAHYTYKAVSPAYIRAKLTDKNNQTSYGEVTTIRFEHKNSLKSIKSSGGQAYAETDGKPTDGVHIREDRKGGKLSLTAYSDRWTNAKASIVWYLYQTAADYDIDIVLNVANNKTKYFEFSVTDINQTGLQEATSIIAVRGNGRDQTYTILNANVPKTGYYRYELKPLNAPANQVTVRSFTFHSLNNRYADTHATNYLSSPSVHLSNWRSTDRTIPAGQKYDWCYMEILVPEGGDPLATYYMSLGVLRGYMGMQTNSDNQRGIIFSLWDDGDTDKDPTLDQNKRAGAVDHDPATTVSRFGNEGTGTKSFVHGWNWDTGVPVKFLTNARLEAYNDTLKNKQGKDSIVFRQNTLVSAWYNSGKGWKYISTLRLPNKISYFDSWYSFLENFGYQNGQIKRYAYYYNAFAHTVSNTSYPEGRWVSFNQVNFGNTDGATGQRVDFEQGRSDDRPNAFYMASGGYGNTVKKHNTIPLQSDKSVVTSLDLTQFLKRVDEAVEKEKRKNDSIKSVLNSMADKRAWKVVGFSSQETSGEGAINGRASTTIDGNPQTYWHSAWQSGTARFPHYITVDMGKEEQVTGFMFQLSGGTNRHQKGIEIQGSLDGQSFSTLYVGNAPDMEKYYIPLSRSHSIRFFKLIIKNSYSGQVHCRINEIDATVVSSNTNVQSVQLDRATVSLFPNPTDGEVYLTTKVAYRQAVVTIYNLQGKRLQTYHLGSIAPSQISTLSLLGLPSSSYLLQVEEADGTKRATQKLLLR